jgi:hypothetical protein
MSMLALILIISRCYKIGAETDWYKSGEAFQRCPSAFLLHKDVLR